MKLLGVCVAVLQVIASVALYYRATQLSSQQAKLDAVDTRPTVKIACDRRI